MRGEYYYLVASLPTLRIGREKVLSKQQFLYECEKWLSPGDKAALYAADGERATRREDAGELLSELIDRDLRLRNRLAGFREGVKKGEAPRVSEDLKPVMDAGDPLEAEIELARLRWRFLDEMASRHFFDINWLVIYFVKIQILERLGSFDKDKGEETFYKLCEVKYGEKTG